MQEAAGRRSGIYVLKRLKRADIGGIDMTVYSGYSGNSSFTGGFAGGQVDKNEYYDSDDDYDISVHCRNYSPGGNANIMDMSDYNTCDNCRHQRQDNGCGLAERTLS